MKRRNSANDGLSPGEWCSCCAVVLTILAVGATILLLFVSGPYSSTGRVSRKGNMSNAFRPRKHAVRFPSTNNSGLCTGGNCLNAAGALSAHVNQNTDPCRNFYGFVCGNYKEASRQIRDQMMASLYENVQVTLEKMKIPQDKLTAVQKAASLFQQCIGVRCESEGEMDTLRKFMDNMDLSFVGGGRGSPLEKIVRLSLEYGIFSLIEVTVDHHAGEQGGKTIKIDISTAHLVWITARQRLSFDYKEKLYMGHMKAYGLPADSKETMDIIKQIISTESQAVGFLSDDKLEEMESFVHIPVTGFHFIGSSFSYTEWCRILRKYARGIYEADKLLTVSPGAVKYLDNLCLIAKCLGLHLLIAWEVLRLLAPLALPRVASLYSESTNREICLSAVIKVMEVPALSVYLFKAVPKAALKVAKDIVDDIRNYALKTIQAAKGISDGSKFSAMKKLRSITVEVGYPCSLRLEETTNTRYKAYPDAACNFLDDWLKASQLTTKWLRQDHGCVHFHITAATVTYIPMRNLIIVPASVLLPPVFALDGTSSTNYGGLGHLVATEMMRAFDVDGSSKAPVSEDHFWWTPLRRCKYAKTVACFRKGHENAVRSHGRRLDGMVDATVMADAMGLALARRSYEDLADKKRLKGLPFEPEQLFFISSCAKWCSRIPFHGYAGNAPPASRCNVMLMNVEQFARAFRCSPNSTMNPSKRCEF